VIDLARGDTAAAELLASRISDPWYRTQALAWVARYASDVEVVRLARQALGAAAECTEPFQQASAAAWPVRALLERGQRDEALLLLEIALRSVPRIQPNSSRSEALFLLLQAAFDAGQDVRRSFLFALADAYDSDPHWRVVRNYEDALVMMHAVDADFARKLAAGSEDKLRQRVERTLAEGGREPRVFFW
jgi:hypothetical protein